MIFVQNLGMYLCIRNQLRSQTTLGLHALHAKDGMCPRRIWWLHTMVSAWVWQHPLSGRESLREKRESGSSIYLGQICWKLKYCLSNVCPLTQVINECELHETKVTWNLEYSMPQNGKMISTNLESDHAIKIITCLAACAHEIWQCKYIWLTHHYIHNLEEDLTTPFA